MPDPVLRFEWADPKLPSQALGAAMSAMFAGDFTLMPERGQSIGTRALAKEFASGMINAHSYRLLVWDAEKLVAWSIGSQTGMEEYYMRNSAVLPDYRRKGLYTKLMNMVMEYTRQSGAQHIYSRHRLDNNAVIIPKLKAGFVISGIDITDRFGPLLVLSYYFDPQRREFFAMRAGSIPPPANLEEFLDR